MSYDTHFLDVITELVRTNWYRTPEELSNMLKEKLNDELILKIVVSGETTNTTVYLIYKNYIKTITPFQSIGECITIREIFPEMTFSPELRLHDFPMIKKFIERITLPKVLLINPYIRDNYPIPRLALNVSIIASYLRKYQKAIVRIFDTQLGGTEYDIINTILEWNPQIVGISIPHAQTSLAITILDRLYKEINKNNMDIKVIAGNFIAASLPEFFLQRYPSIIIGLKEGEKTMSALADYVKGRIKIEEVPDIIFKGTRLVTTSSQFIEMDDLPIPAMDTLDGLAKLKGALTVEWSRGCFWKCTFCPREHKSRRFKGMSPIHVISQLELFSKIMDQFHLKRHLYIADEETIGGDGDDETERIINIANRIIEKNLKISFDTYTRIDQIYNNHQSIKWHIKRMEMWNLLQKAGLARLFLGVESGSVSQIQRYGKGTLPEFSINAMRILSALGIKIRIGFIMFDPLMNFKEIVENIRFLERKDVFLKQINLNDYKISELFFLLSDSNFIKSNTNDEPIYNYVSYMLASLEILVNSSYINAIRAMEKRTGLTIILNDKPDLNLSRLRVKYLNELIGHISITCQKWIDRNFSLAYALKGLFKTATTNEKEILNFWMKEYKRISFHLIKSIVYIFDYNKEITLDEIKEMNHGSGFVKYIEELRIKYIENESLCVLILEEILNIFECFMSNLVEQIESSLISNTIGDTIDNRLKKVINNWKNNQKQWSLINNISIK